MDSDALDKLRGRSRSGLPSPESEDISRRRDSRKGEQQPAPAFALSSLAKSYADDTDKDDQPSAVNEVKTDKLSDGGPLTTSTNRKAEPVKNSGENTNTKNDKQAVSRLDL